MVSGVSWDLISFLTVFRGRELGLCNLQKKRKIRDVIADFE